MASKLTSYDIGYLPGDLSLYPQAIDSYDNLYEAKNLASTKLAQNFGFSGKIMVVDDTTNFPEQGIIRVSLANYDGLTSEMMYYQKKTSNTFQDIIRGFCATRQSSWTAGAKVEAGVMAEHHNSLKDAILQIESNLGTADSTDVTTLNGLLKQQEARYLAPKALFRAYPLKGPAPLTVNFHNFTSSVSTRFFWDFGDGGSSYDKNPSHTYLTEGNYTVQLRVITELGGQGFSTKTSYIQVSNEYTEPFFYVSPTIGYSQEYVDKHGGTVTNFTFIDQTNAQISNRLWQFDDGTNYFAVDPYEHVVTHSYQKAGTYNPSILIGLEGQQVLRVFSTQGITVL